MKHGNEMTNADKIRSISDEELVELIGELVGGNCYNCPACGDCPDYKSHSEHPNCDEHMQKWLKDTEDRSGTLGLCHMRVENRRKTAEKVENHEEKFQYKGWN